MTTTENTTDAIDAFDSLANVPAEQLVRIAETINRFGAIIGPARHDAYRELRDEGFSDFLAEAIGRDLWALVALQQAIEREALGFGRAGDDRDQHDRLLTVIDGWW